MVWFFIYIFACESVTKTEILLIIIFHIFSNYGLIGSIIIGILAGFVANKIMDRSSKGVMWNLVLGIIGGFAGGILFDLLNISWGGTIGQLGTAIVGAVAVLWIAAQLKK